MRGWAGTQSRFIENANEVEEAHWEIELGFLETIGLCRALEALAASGNPIDPNAASAICERIRVDYAAIVDKFRELDEKSEERFEANQNRAAA